MSVVRACDAAAFLTECERDSARQQGIVPDGSAEKIRGLLYFSQGASLAILGGPLFEGDIIAAEDGPDVCPGFMPLGSTYALGRSERAVAALIAKLFTGFTGAGLLMIARREQPWRRARRCGEGATLRYGDMERSFIDRHVAD